MAWIKKLTLIKIILILIGLSLLSTAGYAFYDDYSHRDQIMPGAKIAGIPVGGLHKQKAEALIRKQLAEPLFKPVILSYQNHTWKLPTRAIAQVGIKEMVKAAYSYGWKMSFLERTYHRWFKKPIKINVPLKFSFNQQKITDYLLELAKEINLEPLDARLDVTTGRVKIIPSRKGKELLVAQAQTEIEKILPTFNRMVSLPVKIIPPKKTEEAFDVVILIKQNDHTLSLYHRENLVKTYPIAVGMPEYPTPVGSFKIIRKRINPTWYNPKADWAKEMPDFIPPGPDNPLGSRAMDLNTPGIRIHGTPNEASIGRSVSHGCIRMKMKDAEELFSHVKVGTPVEIIR